MQTTPTAEPDKTLDEMIVSERNVELQQLETDIALLANTSAVLRQQVDDQGETLDHLDILYDKIEADTQSAAVFLKAADDQSSKSWSRKLQVGITITGALIMGAFGVSIALNNRK